MVHERYTAAAIRAPRCANPAASGENAGVSPTIRRPQWSLLFASLAIAGCLVAIGIAVSGSVTGRDSLNLPAVIEQIDPLPAAVRVPAQTSVFVDLEVGYEGVLVIDGLELETVNLDSLKDPNKPGQQITLPPTTVYEPGNATLTFNPSDDASITGFTQGEHRVKVIYWKILEGRGSARSYTWTFNVF
jgi:hypothetical protein